MAKFTAAPVHRRFSLSERRFLLACRALKCFPAPAAEAVADEGDAFGFFGSGGSGVGGDDGGGGEGKGGEDNSADHVGTFVFWLV